MSAGLRPREQRYRSVLSLAGKAAVHWHVWRGALSHWEAQLPEQTVLVTILIKLYVYGIDVSDTHHTLWE